MSATKLTKLSGSLKDSIQIKDTQKVSKSDCYFSKFISLRRNAVGRLCLAGVQNKINQKCQKMNCKSFGNVDVRTRM